MFRKKSSRCVFLFFLFLLPLTAHAEDIWYNSLESAQADCEANHGGCTIYGGFSGYRPVDDTIEIGYRACNRASNIWTLAWPEEGVSGNYCVQPFPDYTAEFSVSTGTQYAPGDVVTILGTVNNIGHVGGIPWLDLRIIDEDGFDVFVGRQIPVELQPGDTVMFPSEDFIIPDIPEGNYQLIYAAAYDDYLRHLNPRVFPRNNELDYLNNLAAPINITISLGTPDLTVSLLSNDNLEDVGAGAELTFEYTVTNSGDAVFGTIVPVEFSVEGEVVGSLDLTGPIAAGANETGEFIYTLPTDIDPNVYDLVATVNPAQTPPEESYDNNGAEISFTVTAPDLVLELAPDKDLYEFGAGESVIASYTVSNDGGSAFSSPSNLRIALILGDSEVSANITIPALDAGAQDEGTVTLSIPVDAAVGTYQLAGEANSEQTGPEEADYENNAVVSAVEVAGRDLELELLADKSNIAAGESVLITVTVTNEGGLPVTESSLLNVVIGDEPEVELANVLIEPLGSKESFVQTIDYQAPDDVIPDTYTIAGVINESQSIFETSYENNAKTLGVTVEGPDLVPELTIETSEIGPGQNLTVNFIVSNNGQADFTRDSTLDFTVALDEVELLETISVAAIPSGEEVEGIATFSIPADTPFNSYEVTAVSNASGNPPIESNTGNNTASASFDVVGPDLALNATIANPEVVAGQDVQLDLVINNLGSVPFPTDVPLEFEIDGVLVGSKTISPPAPTTQISDVITITIPESALPGSLTINGLIATEGSAPIEQGYQNNSAPVTVTVVAPDLAINLVGTVPGDVLPNQLLTLTASISNVGNATYEGAVAGEIAIRKTGELVASLGSFSFTDFEAGETKLEELSAPASENLMAGPHEIVALIVSAPGDDNAANNISDPIAFEVTQEKPNDQEVDCGNPVSVNSGTKKETETDYLGTGAFPLSWMRYYSSSQAIPGGWRFSYSRQLLLTENDGITSAVLVMDNGQRFEFEDVDAQGFSDPDVPGLIARTDSGYVYFDRDGNYHYFDAAGRLTAVENLTGFVQTLNYTDGLLTTVTDHFGKTLIVSHGVDDKIASVTFPDGRQVQYVYTEELLTSVNKPDGTQRGYLYESPYLEHGLTGIIDENGNRFSTYAYDEQGRVILSSHEGTIDQFTFEYGENQTRITNPLGKSTTFFFEERQGLNQIVRIDGDATFYCPAMSSTKTYDDRGFVTEQTDKNGNVTQFTYTHSGLPTGEYLYHVGLVTSQTQAAGTADARTTYFEWHPDFRIPVSVTEPGRKVSFSYDDHARLIQRTETGLVSGGSRTWKNDYDNNGLLISIDGPRADVADITRFTYNVEGELTAITNALGHVTQINSHDANGLPVEVIDPNGLITRLSYDEQLRLTGQRIVSEEGETTTQIGYDSKGNVTSITLPDGQSLSYAYDAADRLIGISNDLGESIAFTLDESGNRIAEVTKAAAGSIVRRQNRVFDELSRLIHSIGAVGQTTEFTYDNNDNLIDVMDALGRQTSLSFDGLDRLIRVADALSGESAFTYDDRDNLIEVVDASGVATQYTYNGLNDLTSEISTARGTTLYSYDSAGNRISTTDANGTTMSYSYDALNRLTRIDYSDARNEKVTYKYDQGDFGIGRLTTLKDESGKTKFRYDQRGNLTKDVRTIRDEKYKTRYTYNLANQLTEIVYPSGRIVAYTLDELSRVVQITTRTNKASPEQVVASGFDYLPFGPASTWTLGNGLATSLSYDQDYRVSQINVSGQETVLDLGFTYDAVSNITDLQDSLGQDSQSFAYDALNRLSAASGSYGDISYTYDPVGNRLSRNVTTVEASSSETYQYESGSHRLAEIVTTTNGESDIRSFSYDPNGNTINDTNGERELAYRYNARNRMAQVHSDGKRVGRYEYNALGQRVAKTYTYPEADQGKKSKSKEKKPKKPKFVKEKLIFIYDQLGNVIAEARNPNKVVREYIYLGNYRIAMVVNNKAKESQPRDAEKQSKKKGKDRTSLYFLHNDHLGTTQKVTDEDQVIVWDSTQKPFGEIELDTEAVRMPMRFPGQYADLETGTSYNYFRDYDPSLGRYVQSDPIGLRGGFNVYSYALLDPVNNIDPDGLTARKKIAEILITILANIGFVGSDDPSKPANPPGRRNEPPTRTAEDNRSREEREKANGRSKGGGSKNSSVAPDPLSMGFFSGCATGAFSRAVCKDLGYQHPGDQLLECEEI